MSISQDGGRQEEQLTSVGEDPVAFATKDSNSRETKLKTPDRMPEDVVRDVEGWLAVVRDTGAIQGS